MLTLHPNHQKYNMPQTLHIAIIGGGAAGFFAAIETKRNFPHADITIFEKNSKVLAKVEITKGNLSGASSASHPVSEIRQIAFHRVAITTGGHPKMENFKHLSDLGHAIEQPIPSLFTFNIADKTFSPLLITHWGMSGPAVLKLSSHAARHLHE